ncbi:uncharacterized protein BCR38DRAFT_79760 [Pseudomassariella vexata]|uniref:Uncharacterized protein n=1 Tax=Pseudomassariella vexata TaxID=1141098 RepID=A0A1Y2DEN1_9PEZI|nr:uncharacterized protein BCR38DRAFT_79760 [Pseudomassariella vexata]ORY57742.1 hypothetical protein BCR38DRAFT_79760 [Pseudomassariella vexata]
MDPSRRTESLSEPPIVMIRFHGTRMKSGIASIYVVEKPEPRNMKVQSPRWIQDIGSLARYIFLLQEAFLERSYRESWLPNEVRFYVVLKAMQQVNTPRMDGRVGLAGSGSRKFYISMYLCCHNSESFCPWGGFKASVGLAGFDFSTMSELVLCYNPEEVRQVTGR